MRYTLPLMITMLSVLFSGFAQAQSTISNSPFDLTGSVGGWITDLPNYNIGSTADGRSAFSDNLNDFGGIVRIDAVRRALGTRTSFEGNAFYAWADSSSSSESGDITLLDPANGSSSTSFATNPNVDSRVRHYGGDLIIRDTWRTRLGGLNAGLAYSLMAFDQDFDGFDGTTRWFDETLNTDYHGAKILSGWDGFLFGRATQLDFNVGIYDMRADYVSAASSTYAAARAKKNKSTHTIETGITTWSKLRDIDLALRVNVMYLAAMPTIERTTGSAVSLSTDDSVTVSCMCEFLLY